MTALLLQAYFAFTTACYTLRTHINISASQASLGMARACLGLQPLMSKVHYFSVPFGVHDGEISVQLPCVPHRVNDGLLQGRNRQFWTGQAN